MNFKMMMTLVILIGMGAITASCNKETPAVKKATMKAVGDMSKTGDEDDEDPVIQGKVRKKNLTPIDNALVETIAYGSVTVAGSTHTDSTGSFTQRVKTGVYYFRITPQGSTTKYVTDTVNVSGNTTVIITPY